MLITLTEKSSHTHAYLQTQRERERESFSSHSHISSLYFIFISFLQIECNNNNAVRRIKKVKVFLPHLYECVCVLYCVCFLIFFVLLGLEQDEKFLSQLSCLQWRENLVSCCCCCCWETINCLSCLITFLVD
jgi:hypothetical protein